MSPSRGKRHGHVSLLVRCISLFVSRAAKAIDTWSAVHINIDLCLHMKVCGLSFQGVPLCAFRENAIRDSPHSMRYFNDLQSIFPFEHMPSYKRGETLRQVVSTASSASRLFKDSKMGFGAQTVKRRSVDVEVV